MKKLGNFIKENKFFLVGLILIYIVLNVKLPFYIEGPGGLINVNERYKIENSYKAKGSMNMTYVSEYKATIASFIMAKFNKDYDIYKKDTIIPSNENESDNNYRGKIMLKEANDNAIINAYKKANKKYEIISQKIVVIYIDEDAKTDLNVGDEIVSINGINISNIIEAKEIINQYKVGDKINFSVKTRDNKEKTKYGYLQKNKIIGILFSYDREIETDPKIEITTKADEYGPSGGLMTTLAIYNKLVKEDITKGYTVSGTGTIEEDGTVGEIDGIKYKLKGAVKNKADIFFAPSGSNYKEAIKLKKKNNYKIKVVEVKTIDDALNYLDKLKEE